MMRSEVWFQKVDGTDNQDCSRSAQFEAWLEVRRNFFSNRTVENWNKIPCEVKNAKTVVNGGHLQNWLCRTQNWTGGKHGLERRRKQDGECRRSLRGPTWVIESQPHNKNNNSVADP